MLDFFDRTQVVDEGNYKFLMDTQVEPYLAKKGREDYFLSYDNRKMHYEVYEKVLSRGSVVVLHGFTESAEKFREVTYYFRKAGYSVFVPDLRGHGKSYHGSQKAERVEIDCFDTYAEDLHTFMEKVVKPASADRKIMIYSHSLGSMVALLYLMKYPYDVKKAVLSSPMICGNMGMPTAVAGVAAKALCLFGGKNVSAPGRCVFDYNATAENSDASSRARFDYYHQKRIKEPLYQTSGPSFSWVKASLDARDKVLSENNLKMLRAELLIFKPEEDKQLLGEYTDKFAQLTKTEVKKAKNSRHEIFMSGDETLKWYFEEIFEFFRE